MDRAGATNSTANVRKLVPSVLLLCFALSGCGTTCVSGFFNGNGSGAGFTSGNASCPLNNATGRLFLTMTAAGTSSTSSSAFPPPLVLPRPSPNTIQHIFVTFRGVEAHPGSVADANSSAWQELAPGLTAHPQQLDLLSLKTDFSSLTSPDSPNVPAVILADEYRQLRLRLVPLHASAEELLPEFNACGSAGWNCLVFADGSIRPLQFEASGAESFIPVEHGTSTLFRVLPGEVIHLSIEFDAVSSVFFPSDAASRFVPAFHVVAHSSTPAIDSQ